MRSLDTIADALIDLKLGKLIIVVDDENRENEGDFIGLADRITPASVNMLVTRGRGMVCAPLTKNRAELLGLEMMVKNNNAPHQTAFTISVDYIHGLTTGISCLERSRTIKALADDNSQAQDFCRPGHIFPLVAQEGGVLVRAGHTEAAVDLAKLCGSAPVGVICEILKENGECARLPDLFELAQELDLKIISIEDLINYRRVEETELVKSGKIPFPTRYGDFTLHLYEPTPTGGARQTTSQMHSQVQIFAQEYHLAITKGSFENSSTEPVLVRVHSECFTGDIFGSNRCDCGDQLAQSLRLIEETGRGVLLYLKQEGRGIGAINKIRAYQLQDQGYDTVTANEALGFKADLRSYEIGVKMLQDLGIKKINLLTNNPQKVKAMSTHGVEVTEHTPLEIAPNETNLRYLMTKKTCMGHTLNFFH